MTVNQQEKTIRKMRRLLLGIVALCLLIGSLTLRWQSASHSALRGSASTSTIQINIPMTQYPTIPPSAPEFTVSMHSLDASGITGSVTLKDIAGTVAILLAVEGLPEEEENEESIMPAEMRFGTCTAPGDLALPLTAPDAGTSETDLSINLKQFNTQRPMAVLLYRSTDDHTAIACGDIP